MELGDLWRWPIPLVIGMAIGQSMHAQDVTMADAARKVGASVKVVVNQFRAGAAEAEEAGAETSIHTPVFKPEIEQNIARSHRERA